MKEKDSSEKTLVAWNDVFADIYNVLVFKGKQVICPKYLHDTKLKSQYKADDDMLHEMERDTSKQWKGLNMNILFGIENQTEPDKDMPFRIMGYDAASYRSQLLNKENKLRYPVITIVLNFGNTPWHYPRNLKNCLIPALAEYPEAETLRNYVQDYQIHVFDIPKLTQEQVSLFQSDFRIVADYFVNSRNNKDYTPSKEIVYHVDEFLKLMKVLTKDSRYEEVGKSFSEEEKRGGLSMCELIDRYENRGLEKGLEKGLAALVRSLKEFVADADELYRAVIKNEEYKNVTKSQIEQYMQ